MSRTVRLAAIFSLAALASACEFVQVAPVPGVPVSQTQGAPAPISTLPTQALCRLRLREGCFYDVIEELTYRGEFSDFELAQIRAARVAVSFRTASAVADPIYRRRMRPGLSI
jgi:hypothetical protein